MAHNGVLTPPVPSYLGAGRVGWRYAGRQRPETRLHRARRATRPATRWLGHSYHWLLARVSGFFGHETTLQCPRLPSVTASVTKSRNERTSTGKHTNPAFADNARHVIREDLADHERGA